MSGEEGVCSLLLSASLHVSHIRETHRCSLVFAEPELAKLREHIVHLNNGNKALRVHFRDLHKEQKKLAREKE